MTTSGTKMGRYMYPGFYPGIIQINSNRSFPYADKIDDKIFMNPKVLLKVIIDKQYFDRLNGYEKHFEYVNGEFEQHEVTCNFRLIKGVSLKVHVKDLETNNPQIAFSPSSWRFLGWLEGFSRFYRYLLDVQVASLMIHGYYPLHCAAISKSDKAVLIIAPSYSGKTCAALKATHYGYNIVAEDKVLFDGERIYPGVLPSSRIYSGLYLTKVQPDLEKNTVRNNIMFKFIKSMGFERLRSICGGMVNCVTTPNCETKPLKISHIVFLEPGPNSISPIDRKEAIRRLSNNNKAEFIWRSSILLRGYSYFNSDFDIRKLEKLEDIFLDNLVDIPSLHICRSKDPVNYFEQINNAVMVNR